MITSLLLSPVTKHHVERKVVHTHPLHLFQIVCDVDQYSQFLPLCTESQVLRRISPEIMEAALTVGLPPLFTERYVSRVNMKRQELIIETKSIQSKWLDSLSSRWKITPISPKSASTGHDDFHPHLDYQSPSVTSGQQSNSKSSSSLSASSFATVMSPSSQQQRQPLSCSVDFSVEITVTDPIIMQALDHVLRQVAGQQVAAFEQRCQQIPIPQHLLNGEK